MDQSVKTYQYQAERAPSREPRRLSHHLEPTHHEALAARQVQSQYLEEFFQGDASQFVKKKKSCRERCGLCWKYTRYMQVIVRRKQDFQMTVDSTRYIYFPRGCFSCFLMFAFISILLSLISSKLYLIGTKVKLEQSMATSVDGNSRNLSPQFTIHLDFKSASLAQEKGPCECLRFSPLEELYQFPCRAVVTSKLAAELRLERQQPARIAKQPTGYNISLIDDPACQSTYSDISQLMVRGKNLYNDDIMVVKLEDFHLDPSETTQGVFRHTVDFTREMRYSYFGVTKLGADGGAYFTNGSFSFFWTQLNPFSRSHGIYQPGDEKLYNTSQLQVQDSVDTMRLLPYSEEHGLPQSRTVGSVRVMYHYLNGVEVKVKEYYTLNDIVSSIGGTIKVLQIVLTLLTISYIYDHFTKTMAKRIVQQQVHSRHLTQVTRVTSEWGSQIRHLEDEKAQVSAAQKLFQERLSSESLFYLYDRIDELEARIHKLEAENRQLKVSLQEGQSEDQATSSHY